MFELIRCDIQRYNKHHSNLLIATINAAYTHPAFYGVIWYRIGHALWMRRRNPLFFILLVFHRIIYPLVRIQSGLELSPRAQIGPGLYVAHFGPTIIHSDTIAGSHLTVLQGVTIGEHGGGVPRIGNNVSIATGAKLIGGITIGDNVIVGAGAVVIRDIPAGCTVIGIPAKPVNSVEELEALNNIDEN
jgi:serine O-acetyltransferase